MLSSQLIKPHQLAGLYTGNNLLGADNVPKLQTRFNSSEVNILIETISYLIGFAFVIKMFYFQTSTATEIGTTEIEITTIS